MHENNDHFTVLWSIKNFSMLTYQLGSSISSPRFKICLIGDSELKLEVTPNGDEQDGHRMRSFQCFLYWTLSHAFERDFKLAGVLHVFLFRSFEFEVVLGNGSFFNFPSVLFDDLLEYQGQNLPNDTLTIRLEILSVVRAEDGGKIEINTPPTVGNDTLRNLKYFRELRIETTVVTQTKKALWSIKNFRSLPALERLTVLLFSALENHPSFYGTLYRRNANSVLGIEIRKSPSDEVCNVFVRCRVSVFVSLRRICYSAEDYFWFPDSNRVWIFPEFLNAAVMKRDKYFDKTDGALRIQFELASSVKGKTHHSEIHLADEVCLSPTTPRPPMNSSGYDVILRAGDQDIKACKRILRAGSQFFEDKLANNNDTGVIRIGDVDPKTLKLVVDFLHSGPDDRLWYDAAAATSLYEVAEKYRMPSLMSHCTRQLARSLSVVNVCEILEFAHKHKNDRLLEFAQDFIEANRDNVLGSPRWSLLMMDNVALAASVMHRILVRKF